ncbi:hypothetical protein D3C80_1980670 [compost metagenome]
MAEVAHGLGGTQGGIAQALALRVFAEAEEDIPIMPLQVVAHAGSPCGRVT